MSIQDCYDNLNTIVQTILTTFPDCEIIIQTTNPTFRVKRNRSGYHAYTERVYLLKMRWLLRHRIFLFRNK